MHLEQLTHWLSNELNDLDVEKVEVVKSGKAPEGTKGIPDFPAWGSLLVSAIPGVIPSLVGTVQSWLSNRTQRDKDRSASRVDPVHGHLGSTDWTSKIQEYSTQLNPT